MSRTMKHLSILLIGFLVFTCLSISDDSDATNPIDLSEVSYENESLLISGSVNVDNYSSLQICVTGPDGFILPFDFLAPISKGSFDMVSPVGDLEDGEYSLFIFSSDGAVVASKNFSVHESTHVSFVLKQTHSITVGSRVSLNNLITIYPAEYASKIEWSVSNSHISVEDGFVNAISPGVSILTGVLDNNGIIITRTCSITVSQDSSSQPQTGLQKDYTFYIQVRMDSDVACVGSSFSALDLRQGLTFTVKADDASEALQIICDDNSIPVELGDRPGTEGWIVQLFHLGDEQQPDGTWKYWVQYHDGNYNEWTLGHYSDGGSFGLIYTITAEIPQAKTGLYYTGSDIIGVPSGPGYTVVGGIAKEVGTYTATATLTDDEYMWTDGTVEPKTIVWQILGNNQSPDEPEMPEVPTEHLNPEDQGVETEHDSKTNDDGTVTDITTITKTDDEGKVITTVISTTTRDDGTVEEIKSTYSTEEKDGVKRESALETIVEKDENGAVTSETNVTVYITDNTESEDAVKEIVLEASDDNGNATVKAIVSADAESTTMLTEVKITESDGQIEFSDGSLDVALKMQEVYSRKLTDVVESVKDIDKVIQVKTESSDAQMTFASESLKKISDSESSFTLMTAKGSVNIDRDVVSNFSQKEDVTLSLATADRSSMTAAQREAIESGSTTISLRATAGGESIGDELGGKVTVTVKHIAAEGKTAVAYYVDDNGRMTKVADQSYDAVKGEMTMVLDHFSIYTIVDESPAGEGLPVAVLVMTAVIALICLGILLPQVVGRKQ